MEKKSVCQQTIKKQIHGHFLNAKIGIIVMYQVMVIMFYTPTLQKYTNGILKKNLMQNYRAKINYPVVRLAVVFCLIIKRYFEIIRKRVFLWGSLIQQHYNVLN